MRKRLYRCACMGGCVLCEDTGAVYADSARMRRLGSFLKQERLHYRLTLSEAVEITGISTMRLSLMEEGYIEPDLYAASMYGLMEEHDGVWRARSRKKV